MCLAATHVICHLEIHYTPAAVEVLELSKGRPTWKRPRNCSTPVRRISEQRVLSDRTTRLKQLSAHNVIFLLSFCLSVLNLKQVTTVLANLRFCRACTTYRSMWATRPQVCSLARPTWAYVYNRNPSSKFRQACKGLYWCRKPARTSSKGTDSRNPGKRLALRRRRVHSQYLVLRNACAVDDLPGSTVMPTTGRLSWTTNNCN